MDTAGLPRAVRPLLVHISAGFPIIYVASWEEERVCEHLGIVATGHMEPSRALVTWSFTEGFSDHIEGPERALHDPMAALDRVLREEDPVVWVLKDYHVYIAQRPDIVRRLRDVYYAIKDTDRTLIVLAPIVEVPPELVKEMYVYDYPLPDPDETRQIVELEIWTHFHRSGQRVTFDHYERADFERTLLGLTREEMKRALRKSFLHSPKITIDHAQVVLEEKRQILRKTEILEFIQIEDDLSAVGGLKQFKAWCKIRHRGLEPEAREFGLPLPKGILLTGISGCGKSLAITALAREWRLPLLRLDMGRVFAGLAGSPEQSLRRAILTAEAVSPCVLWIDEIEMGISVFSDSVESGATSRNFASFLTWMQEKKTPVFIAATANDIDRLPPEFIRKGRFDEVFFVDLPSEEERKEIFRIHFKKKKQVPSETSLDGLAKSTKGYTGAEIEQALISALYECFSKNRPLALEDIYRAIGNMVPLSVTMKEDITKVKRWADNRAVRANTGEP
ncbi:MAG: AAA family ATPase [Deltaproteobacteria bacterium]|nr:AAA family ATPase [Deltaproteobacteria bacterium]